MAGEMINPGLLAGFSFVLPFIRESYLNLFTWSDGRDAVEGGILNRNCIILANNVANNQHGPLDRASFITCVIRVKGETCLSVDSGT